MILVNAAADVKTRFTSQIELYSSIGKHTNVLQFFGVCTVAGKIARIWASYDYAILGKKLGLLHLSAHFPTFEQL